MMVDPQAVADESRRADALRRTLDGSIASKFRPRASSCEMACFLDEPRQEPFAEGPHQGLCVPSREGVERSVV
jgi:hypothetical protein